ncbi:MAG: pilus assembly protein PilM [Vicinamibacterales bacterium]|nr:pilus assembly protein PilM [Vicinamibacterales bacterium]
MKLPAFLRTPPPDVALEIGAGRITAARLQFTGRPTVAAHAVEPLPEGAVVPGLAGPNMPDVGVVGAAARRVLERVAPRARRVALVVPDTVARVSLVRFETVPAKAADLDALVRWQVKKTTPFALDLALVRYTPGQALPDGGREFVVVVVREDVIRQYEQACAMAGAEAGLVDLASFNFINAVEAGRERAEGDWLLVHVAPGYATLAVVRDRVPIFFRNRTEEGEGSLADLVHQTAMYYEDRLSGGGFARVLLAGAGGRDGGGEALRRELSTRLGQPVELADPRAAAGLADRIDAAPELLDALAPLVGILCRERVA